MSTLTTPTPRPTPRRTRGQRPPPTRNGVTSALATVAALGSVGQAVAHVPVIEPHLVEAPYLGIGFVLLAVAGFYLAIRLAVDPDELVWAATGAIAGLAVVGYVLSRTVGLPQIGDDVGAWGDPLGVTAVSCELVMIVAVVGHHLDGRRRSSRARRGVIG